MVDQNDERSLDVSAKTIDEAIERGLAQLGLPRDQVDIEIIREGKRGVFGLGAEEAEVRLTPKDQQSTGEFPSAPTAAPPEESTSPETEAGDEPPSTTQTEPPSAEIATPVEEPEAGEANEALELAKNHLTNLLRLMQIEAEVTTRVAPDLVEEGEEPPLVLDIKGKDLGILIGRRSETLRALQYMIRLMVSKEMKSWQPIVVDVESYRVRRRRSLRQMAQKMAERAVNTQKRVVLESMPAYERRIIHLTLKDHPDVFTKSIGSDENRKVTIIPN